MKYLDICLLIYTATIFHIYTDNVTGDVCGQSCGATGDPTARPLLMAATQVLLDIRYYCQILYCVSLQHVDIKHNIGQNVVSPSVSG